METKLLENQTQTMLLEMPVDLLWLYREFNRMVHPAPQLMFLPASSFRDISNDIDKNGLKEPIDLSVWQGKALVTDGNHRLGIFKHQNRRTIPVRVTFYPETLPEFTFKSYTMKRFRKVNPSLEQFITK